MENIAQFIGRFHPLLVHLPIGILLVAVLFDFLAKRERFSGLKTAIPLLYLLGGWSALFSCATGYLLSTSGDYSGTTLQQHQWLGISSAVLAFLIYFLKKSGSPQVRQIGKWIPVGLFILISITGHLGGSLTHGTDYLYEYMPEPFKGWLVGKTEPTPIIADVQQALVYDDIIVPILRKSCYKCHSQQKQKGKLRLDSPAFIASGGKSGQSIINLTTPEASEILRRIHLPLNDDEHMPPNEKDELTTAEKALLAWWIEQGANYEVNVQNLDQPADIIPYLSALEGSAVPTENSGSDYPAAKVSAAAPAAIQALLDIRAVVLPIGAGSPFLSVNFVNVNPIDTTAIQLLTGIQQQVVWLKLSDSEFNDSQMAALSQMPYLNKLYLDHTLITDVGLEHIQGLSHLKYLNLVGTKVTAKGLQSLQVLPALKQLFIFQTQTSANEKATLIQDWKTVEVDTGGYWVSTLARDTIR